MFELTDYPFFDDDCTYIVAMAGGEGEECTGPIREYVRADRDTFAKFSTFTQDQEDEAMLTPLEHWVDSLLVLRDGEEAGRWTRATGWVLV